MLSQRHSAAVCCRLERYSLRSHRATALLADGLPMAVSSNSRYIHAIPGSRLFLPHADQLVWVALSTGDIQFHLVSCNCSVKAHLSMFDGRFEGDLVSGQLALFDRAFVISKLDLPCQTWSGLNHHDYV